jgi:hypothetical protein
MTALHPREVVGESGAARHAAALDQTEEKREVLEATATNLKQRGIITMQPEHSYSVPRTHCRH